MTWDQSCHVEMHARKPLQRFLDLAYFDLDQLYVDSSKLSHNSHVQGHVFSNYILTPRIDLIQDLVAWVEPNNIRLLSIFSREIHVHVHVYTEYVRRKNRTKNDFRIRWEAHTRVAGPPWRLDQYVDVHVVPTCHFRLENNWRFWTEDQHIDRRGNPQ
jgi:hypothetical protein